MNASESWTVLQKQERIVARRVRHEGGPVPRVLEKLRLRRGSLDKQLESVRKEIKKRDPDAVMVKHFVRYDPDIIEVWI